MVAVNKASIRSEVSRCTLENGGRSGAVLLPPSDPGLAVENAMKMSPGPLASIEPVRPKPKGHPFRNAPNLVGHQRRIRTHDYDDGSPLRLLGRSLLVA